MTLGKIVIFSAPSGAGKTTIVKHLVSTLPQLRFSISATTRDKRPNEVHGKDYYFLSVEEFKEKIAQDAFVEYEQVYEGLYYGTLKSEVERIISKGNSVILDVDVQGGIHLKDTYKDKALAIFVEPPDIDTLIQRLVGRNTETEESLKKRVDKANYELSFSDRFDTVLLNDNLGKAFGEAEALVLNFLSTRVL